MKKILLAYSGGLDTSAIIPWLKENYTCEVIAYCCNLGNLPPKDTLEAKSRDLGASRFIFEDLREEFCNDFVFPLIRSGAKYQKEYLLGTAIGRPLIAERLAHHALELSVQGIVHGATGKGNDQLRFENSLAYLVPDTEIIAPWKIWGFKGRIDLINYLQSKNFSYTGEIAPEFSLDSNIFHTSTEGGVLEDITADYTQVTELKNQIHQHESKDIELSFENGILTKVDGQCEASHVLLEKLNQIASQYGIGKIDLVEERINGLKSRGLYLTPGGTLIHHGLNCLKHINWDRKLLSVSSLLSQTYADLVYDGLWHCNARYSLEAFFEHASRNLCGDVGLRLNNNQIDIIYRKSNYSLYDQDLMSFEKDNENLHKYAEGFCKTINLKQKQAGLISRKNAK